MAASWQEDTVAGLHVVHAPATDSSAPEGGQRPPLLLVHGACHGAWCWELWQGRLPGLGWESYALSLRNHPGSHAVDERVFREELRVADYAQDVATVADRIGRPCLVVGHSMGGIVSQCFAARYTAAGKGLAGLVLLNSTIPGALGAVRGEPLPTGRAFLPDRETTVRMFFHSATPEVVERAVSRMTPESPSVMNEYSLAPGVTVGSAEIACPMLVVTAEYDGTIVPRDRRIADYFGADYFHDEHGGHDAMLERGWAELLDEVLRWADARVANLGSGGGGSGSDRSC